jgi:hypothetical protein
MKNWNRCFAFLLLLVLIASLPGLVVRWRLESQNTETALVADIADVEAIAEESGVTFMDALKTLSNAGLTALVVHELTGEDILAGALPVETGPAARFFGYESEAPEHAVLAIHADSPLTAEILDYVKTKFPFAEVKKSGDILHVILPVSYSSIGEMGLLPDFRGLDLASLTGMPIVYRPSSSPGVSGENVAAALSWILKRHGSVNAVIPRGIAVAGYPDVKPLIEVLKSRNIAVAKVEFSGQIGASSLEKAMFPRVLPLHSVPDEEILVRRISREELVDRFVRAARERSVRILYIRPPSFFSGNRLNQMEDECLAIAGRIQGLGLKEGWPLTYSHIHTGFFAAFALSLAVLALVLKTGSRFFETEKTAQKKNLWMTVGVVLSLSLVFAPALLKVSLFARIFGALAASLGAAEATLAALDGKDKPIRRILKGVGIAFVTGLSIAAFFSNTWYMLRMSTFSGVKISLLLPPAIVLLHDLRRRVHPESLEEVLSRPPIWGEIVLFSVLFGMAGLVLLRSGNVSFIPGWEKAFRETLEQLLVARPRTKEFLAGYPSLILWYVTARMGIWERYREVFRLTGTLAFSSVINSFCHFHTHLFFILLRVGNGLWSGVAVGLFLSAVLVWVILPAARRWGKVFTT